MRIAAGIHIVAVKNDTQDVYLSAHLEEQSRGYRGGYAGAGGNRKHAAKRED